MGRQWRKYKYALWEVATVLLLRHVKHANDYVTVEGCTQLGIAKVLNINRAHVACILNAMLQKKYVEEHLKHVEGHPTKLKSYNLTPEGYALAKQIKKMMDDDGDTIESFIKDRPKPNPISYVSNHDMFKKVSELEKRLDTLERSSR